MVTPGKLGVFLLVTSVLLGAQKTWVATVATLCYRTPSHPTPPGTNSLPGGFPSWSLQLCGVGLILSTLVL